MNSTIHTIELEDLGQDLLRIITDSSGKIIRTEPFHTSLYKDGFIALESQELGEPCMIHHPPHYNYGFLKYKVVGITSSSETIIDSSMNDL